MQSTPFDQIDKKGMPAYFRETLSTDPATQVRKANELMNEIDKPPSEQSLETRIELMRLHQAAEELKRDRKSVV